MRWNRQSFEGARLDFNRARTIRLADQSQVGNGVGMLERLPEFFRISRFAQARIDTQKAGQRYDSCGVANEADVAPPEISKQEWRGVARFHLVPRAARRNQRASVNAHDFALLEIIADGLRE